MRLPVYLLLRLYQLQYEREELKLAARDLPAKLLA